MRGFSRKASYEDNIRRLISDVQDELNPLERQLAELEKEKAKLQEEVNAYIETLVNYKKRQVG